MDELSYTYQPGTNKLLQVTDPVSAVNYANDFDGTSNYTYDELGQLLSDSAEEIDEIQWTVSGKVKRITRTSTSTKDDLSFEYDAMGQRIMKTVYPKSASGVVDLANVKSYYYIRDAQGNTMALYIFKNNEFTLAEQYMYGSARLGVTNSGMLIDTPADTMNYVTVYNTLGEKQYELSNHLGNVLVTVSDKKIVEPNGSMTEVAFYYADVSSANDYYPFGMQMPNRHGASGDYRYGYQGSEMDNEVKGNGNSYTTHYRMLDPRVGRWLSTDPLTSISNWESPYVSMGNNPIQNNDIFGDVFDDKSKEGVKKHKESTNKKIKETQTKIGELTNTISQQTDGKATEKQLTQLNNLNNALTEFNDAISEIEQLEKSNQLYSITKINVAINGLTGQVRADLNTGAIVAEYIDESNLAHELKHLYQFEIGTLSFSKQTGGRGYLYDATDEIEAYNRQSYYNGMVSIRNMTAADVRNLHPAYSDLKDGPLNKYSRLQKIFEGTPEGDAWLKSLSEEQRKLQFLGSGVDELDLVR